jgi:hypothetical protein
MGRRDELKKELFSCQPESKRNIEASGLSRLENKIIFHSQSHQFGISFHKI